MIRGGSDSNFWVPLRRPPTRIASPSTRRLFARIDPTSAALTTPVSPARKAKRDTNNSGRFATVDWMTPVAPEFSRVPSCSIASPTVAASAPSPAAATMKVSTGGAAVKVRTAVATVATRAMADVIRSRRVKACIIRAGP